ncbi:Kinesin-like protein kif21b [Apophysomyces ossiformis]|uniref:Kinesin-like protein kif21b n=1 Tax=Apophysomyces ossiformis TaxID=679940 RepID=A0A8H7BWX6_9FUNG|nr:Kinesin-like protein kif21b [Apophysomyces ossiformis]
MGTGLDSAANPENEGIVPRCIVELFRTLQERTENPDYTYEVYVSFLELYNEELIDLLNPQSKRKSNSHNTEVSIREDIAGNIYWSGVKEERCHSPEELLGFLAQGSLCRTTGSTEMNTVSSRSHAIFSVILKQTRPADDESQEMHSVTSKFHFVDLAGSERLKRTHAQGDRAREGIAINSGLLALGNVISALGDETRRAAHVPYRDSKLTRLLQDSLGGNSQTLMLACVSPADTNFMETLNTLKYANRARNIKNRVTINQDFAGSSIEVNQLRALVSRLRMEIASLRADGATDSFGGNDEIRSLRAEVVRLRDRIQDMTTNMIQVTSERDTLRMERDLGEFMMNEGDTQNDTQTNNIQMHPIIAEYQKTIQELNNDLADTRDRLAFLENMRSSARAMAMANSMPSISASLSNSALQDKPVPQMSVSSQRRRKFRRRRPGRISATSSTATNGGRSSKTTSKNSSRRMKISKSISKERKRNITTDVLHEEEDEGYVNDISEEDVRNEVKESIAKARAEIQRGMEVLELIKPLDETAEQWEAEIKAFEEEQQRLYGEGGLRSTPEDEGHFSCTPSPIHDDYADEIEALAVPSWEDASKPKQALTLSGSSVEQSQASSGRTKVASPTYDLKYSPTHDLKCNPQLVRILHQIQADIKVKEELVSHLEKSETEYAFMRRKFDEKIAKLQTQLADLQRERDIAVMRTKSGFAIKSDISVQMREKQQLIEIRHAYEAKTKSLLSEIQELKRKYAQTTTTIQATRNQNDTLLKSLKINVETLKVEKKRMIKRMRQEAERVREQMSLQERKIQQLQRLQAEANNARRRLEREHEAQKQTLKKRNEEVMINNSQLKQLTNVLKKAVREGGILDERLLGKVSHIMGGNFAVIARGGGHGFPKRNVGARKKVNPVPVKIRASRKKQLLDRALCQYIQGKQAVVEMEQLLVRRERLADEKLELIEERKGIYLAQKESMEMTGQPMDTMALEFMDERIDLISAEISYLSARIRALQSEAAGEDLDHEEAVETIMPPRAEKRVTFADEIVTDPLPNDEWADMDAFEEQYSVPSNAAPELAYDITVKILKSLEPDECKRIAENLVDDIMNLRMSECNRQVTMQNLEKTVMDLRRTLIVMKRAAIATTVENERRIRRLEDRNSNDGDSAIDFKIEEYINSGNTIFDKIYEDGLRGMINTPEPGVDHGFQSPGSPVEFNGDGGSPTSPSTPIANGNRPQSSMKPPAPLADKLNRPLVGDRETTPSPDRFYNMIQKRLSWQQRTGGSESPIPITMINPAEFAKYTADRDSSTSSIRSSHLRRSSVSDYSSSQSQNSYNTNSNSSTSQALRKRAHSLQAPAARRRASMRELSANVTEYEELHYPQPPSSPLASISQQRSTRRAAVQPTMERSVTPSTGNVFARLSQTPTRASRAKMAYRHSSSSVDDLRKRWEAGERSSSAMSGLFYEA